MILVVNPLHYKRPITKTRVHMAFMSIFLFIVILNTCFFMFLRQDAFKILKECAVQYVTQAMPYFVMLGTNYVCLITMTVNCIIISIKLQKMKTVTLGTKTSTQDNDHKLTQACWMTLKLFILCFVPFTCLGFFAIFLQQPYPLVYEILLDMSYLLYYMNNIINPFVYYAFLKNFQEGYLSMLVVK